MNRIVQRCEAIRLKAEALVVEAESCGVVLTIEQTPLTPLAMGFYETAVSVRPSRERYGVILTHETNKQ